EFSYIVVVERQTGRSAFERISGKIHLAADYSSFHLSCSISAVAVRFQHAVQIDHEKERHTGIAAQGLIKSQVGSLLAEISRLKQLKRVIFTAIVIGTRRQAFNAVDYCVDVIKRGSINSEIVGWNAL